MVYVSWDFTIAFVVFGVQNRQVVFVDNILYAEIGSSQEPYDRRDDCVNERYCVHNLVNRNIESYVKAVNVSERLIGGGVFINLSILKKFFLEVLNVCFLAKFSLSWPGRIPVRKIKKHYRLTEESGSQQIVEEE